MQWELENKFYTKKHPCISDKFLVWYIYFFKLSIRIQETRTCNALLYHTVKKQTNLDTILNANDSSLRFNKVMERKWNEHQLRLMPFLISCVSSCYKNIYFYVNVMFSRALYCVYLPIKFAFHKKKHEDNFLLGLS